MEFILLIHYISDLTVPLVHWADPKDMNTESVRTSRASLVILTCHLLIPVLRNLHTVIMGCLITASHVAVLIFITHRHRSDVAILVTILILIFFCYKVLNLILFNTDYWRCYVFAMHQYLMCLLSIHKRNIVATNISG